MIEILDIEHGFFTLAVVHVRSIAKSDLIDHVRPIVLLDGFRKSQCLLHRVRQADFVNAQVNVGSEDGTFGKVPSSRS
jgi:hypothetical protein